MRVATWNVNGLRARLEFVLAWLEDRKPDVVGFQELKMTDDQFPTELFAEAGYQVQVHGQKAWNGVAILTRSEAELVQTGLFSMHEACAFRTKVPSMAAVNLSQNSPSG